MVMYQETVDKKPMLEWLAENYKSFGCVLEFITNKSQEGSQFCRGFGGIGGLLRYQVRCSLGRAPCVVAISTVRSTHRLAAQCAEWFRGVVGIRWTCDSSRHPVTRSPSMAPTMTSRCHTELLMRASPSLARLGRVCCHPPLATPRETLTGLAMTCGVVARYCINRGSTLGRGC